MSRSQTRLSSRSEYHSVTLMRSVQRRNLAWHEAGHPREAQGATNSLESASHDQRSASCLRPTSLNACNLQDPTSRTCTCGAGEKADPGAWNSKAHADGYDRASNRGHEIQVCAHARRKPAKLTVVRPGPHSTWAKAFDRTCTLLKNRSATETPRRLARVARLETGCLDSIERQRPGRTTFIATNGHGNALGASLVEAQCCGERGPALYLAIRNPGSHRTGREMKPTAGACIPRTKRGALQRNDLASRQSGIGPAGGPRRAGEDRRRDDDVTTIDVARGLKTPCADRHATEVPEIQLVADEAVPSRRTALEASKRMPLTPISIAIISDPSAASCVPLWARANASIKSYVTTSEIVRISVATVTAMGVVPVEPLANTHVTLVSANHEVRSADEPPALMDILGSTVPSRAPVTFTVPDASAGELYEDSCSCPGPS
eukprot:2368891-Rhodomonas_salina.1